MLLYGEFEVDGGDPMLLKRLRWLRLLFETTVAQNIRLTVFPNVVADTLPTSGHVNYDVTVASTDTYKEMILGGLGRNFRFRLSTTGYPSATTTDVLPSVTGKCSFLEFTALFEALSAR